MAVAIEEILKRVAAGELTPEDALRLIDDETGAPAGPTQPPAPDPAPAGEPDLTGAEDPVDAGQVRAVRVVTAYRQVTVVADATVAHAHVTGRHSVRQEGDLLIVVGGQDPFGAHRDSDKTGLRFAFTALPRGLSWATSWPDGSLTVRINPRVRLEVEATGASLRVSGLEVGASLRLLACSLKVDRLRGPLDVDARTSSIEGSLGPNGHSRIAAEQSWIKVRLLPGTDLQITATNRMGEVILPGRFSREAGGIGETMQSRVGSGAATLTLNASMSSVIIGTEPSARKR